DDHLSGDANANVLTGGGGNDSLDGGFGADVLTGGGGVDTARYNARTAPVAVSLDGVANDGEAHEGDNVSVENVLGGSGGDRLTGGPGKDSMSGGGGNDTLLARDRTKDHVDGGAGRDAATVDRHLDVVVNVEQLR